MKRQVNEKLEWEEKVNKELHVKVDKGRNNGQDRGAWDKQIDRWKVRWRNEEVEEKTDEMRSEMNEMKEIDEKIYRWWGKKSAENV